MSLPCENRSQKNSPLEALIAANTESLERMEDIPYQPIVYAIPKEQREEEFKLIQQAVKFQPELYRKMEPLATKDELTKYCRTLQETERQYIEQAVSRLTEANLKTTAEMQARIEQAGRMQEKFISDASKALDFGKQELGSVIRGLRRRITGLMAAAFLGSLLLSVLVSALLPQLLS